MSDGERAAVIKELIGGGIGAIDETVVIGICDGITDGVVVIEVFVKE